LMEFIVFGNTKMPLWKNNGAVQLEFFLVVR